MAAPPQQQPSLEGLVAHYRRAQADPNLRGAEIELELRFQGVDRRLFETILAALARGEAGAGPGAVTCAVSAIMEEAPGAKTHRHREAPRVSLIRQIAFDPAGGARGGERYYRKWPLAPPHRVRNPQGLSYGVFLSAEEPLAVPFVSDAGALIRVKSRASFPVGSGWRADLTVSRSLQGADAQAALGGVVERMFRRAPLTPANMLAVLGQAGAEGAEADVYSYELEVERAAGEGGAAPLPSEVTALAAEVLRLANPGHVAEAAYQAEIHHVASFVEKAPGVLRRFEHEWGLKKLVPQVVALTRNDYQGVYPPTGYYLLDKADGVRALASVRGARLALLAEGLREYGGPPAAGATIVDGELVGGAFHAFDVIALRGENVSGEGYGARAGRLAEAAEVLRAYGLDARPKPVVHLTGATPAELKAQFAAAAGEGGRPYGTDGLILMAPGRAYRDEGGAYKWKPLRETTIDFLARRPPPSVLGRRPYVDAPGHELYLLFVGINRELFEALGLERAPGYRELFGERGGSYFPVQFAPSDAPLAYLYQHPVEAPPGGAGWAREIEGRVVELRCGGGCAAAGAGGPEPPAWEFVRIREDRDRELRTQQYFGNDFRVAELTWLNYVDPFREEMLWEGPAAGYWTAPKSPLYRSQTAFTSYVKDRRIAGDLAHAAWVVDVGIGKGQDFGRYVRAGVRHVVGIDKDRGGLSELVRRKYTEADARRGGQRRGGQRREGRRGTPTTLYALQADASAPAPELAGRVRAVAGFPAGGADALVINLVINYLAGSVVSLRNFAALCLGLVKVGGLVVITTIGGQRVHDFFARKGVGPGETWESRQDGVLKYAIRRDYSASSLTPAGQQIGILLPFSAGVLYTEYLVNVGTVVNEFKLRGFALVSALGFADRFEDFKTQNPARYKQLTPADLEYLSLYEEVVLRREK